MKRSHALFACVLLAGTALSGTAHAGWFSSDKPKEAAKPAAAQPAPSIESTLVQAQQARVAGDLAGATRTLAQLMLAYPDDPRIVGEYGKLLAQQGRSDDAVSFLKRATELNPGDWTLYSALGVAYDQVNDAGNAKLSYDRALQIKPGNPVVLNNYGVSRMLVGDLDGAQRMLAQAQAAPNPDPKVLRNLAMVAQLRAASPRPGAAVAANRVAKPLPENVVMQKVPVDPKAGQVVAAKQDTKPDAKSSATQPPRQLTAENKAKPAAPAAAKKNTATPALRMTADASSD
jgi:Flp pilus assembly protein TadD